MNIKADLNWQRINGTDPFWPRWARVEKDWSASVHMLNDTSGEVSETNLADLHALTVYLQRAVRPAAVANPSCPDLSGRAVL